MISKTTNLDVVADLEEYAKDWRTRAANVEPVIRAIDMIKRLKEVISVERERCALVALEQRCERGTAWDLACVQIAAAIMKPTCHEKD